MLTHRVSLLLLQERSLSRRCPCRLLHQASMSLPDSELWSSTHRASQPRLSLRRPHQHWQACSPQRRRLAALCWRPGQLWRSPQRRHQLCWDLSQRRRRAVSLPLVPVGADALQQASSLKACFTGPPIEAPAPAPLTVPLVVDVTPNLPVDASKWPACCVLCSSPHAAAEQLPCVQARSLRLRSRRLQPKSRHSRSQRSPRPTARLSHCRLSSLSRRAAAAAQRRTWCQWWSAPSWSLLSPGWATGTCEERTGGMGALRRATLRWPCSDEMVASGPLCWQQVWLPELAAADCVCAAFLACQRTRQQMGSRP